MDSATTTCQLRLIRTILMRFILGGTHVVAALME